MLSGTLRTGDWLRREHWLLDRGRGDRAGFWMDTQDLWNAHYSTLRYLYLSSNWEVRDFSCKLRKLRIRQREAGTKTAFHSPCNCFQIGLCCHRTGTRSMPTLPWLDMELGPGWAARCVPTPQYPCWQGWLSLLLPCHRNWFVFCLNLVPGCFSFGSGKGNGSSNKCSHVPSQDHSRGFTDTPDQSM